MITEEFNTIVEQITALLPQLSNFIDQFNKVIIENDVNIFSDSNGNFSADVLKSMSEEQSDKIVKRIGIIDSLIDSHKTTISDLFSRGSALEKDIKINNPSFKSPLLEKAIEFRKISKSYQH